jgi:hypothetical protein
MTPEQLTDTASDITTDKEWVNQQIDRLLAWELLRRELTCDVSPVETASLCDSIGVNKGYVHTVLQSVKPKFQSLIPPDAD